MGNGWGKEGGRRREEKEVRVRDTGGNIGGACAVYDLGGGLLVRYWPAGGEEVEKLGRIAGIDGPGGGQSATRRDNGLSQWDRS